MLMISPLVDAPCTVAVVRLCVTRRVGGSPTVGAGNPSRHWLYEWIDEFEVRTSDDVRSRLRDRGAVSRLSEIAGQNIGVNYSDVPQTGAIVAGPGLEISSAAACNEFVCRKQHIDTEMGQLLH